MLSRPLFGDQLATGRYVADSWKVGVLLEGAVERGVVETAIRKLMEDEEGEGGCDEGKSGALKEKVRMSVERGGSSQQAVDKLVDHMLSL